MKVSHTLSAIMGGQASCNGFSPQITDRASTQITPAQLDRALPHQPCITNNPKLSMRCAFDVGAKSIGTTPPTLNSVSCTEASGLSCPLLPIFAEAHSASRTNDNEAPTTPHESDKMIQLVKLKSNLESLLSRQGLQGEINWRLKSADSTLGKLILRAIHPNPKQPLIVRDAQHACQLIAENHERLQAFVQQLSSHETTHPALLDQLGLRIVLSPPAKAEDCLQFAAALKKDLNKKPNADLPTLAAFALNPEIPEKDYINHPKANGYQSLHLSLHAKTDQTGQGGNPTKPTKPFPIELQIRTDRMHREALRGDASHENYKENQRLLLRAFKAFYGILGTQQTDRSTSGNCPYLQIHKDAAQQGCAF